MSQHDIFKTAMLATAATMDMEAAVKNFEAARTRGDIQGAELHRQRAHDMLDSVLDLKAVAIDATTALGKTP